MNADMHLSSAMGGDPYQTTLFDSSGSNPVRVEWDEVQDSAKLAFSIWLGQPELEWAKRAWGLLARAGLTEYGTERERHVVLLRFLVLGGIYSDFCDAAWEESSEPSYSYWAEPLDLNPFLLGQLYTLLPDMDPELEDVSEALETLVEAERDRVVKALLRGFGGVTGLYTSLWQSRRIDGEVDQDEDDTYEPDGDQVSAYSWVAEGCYRYR